MYTSANDRRRCLPLGRVENGRIISTTSDIAYNAAKYAS